MNEEKPIIAKRIKFLRKENGLTQEQLAQELGLSAKSSIANYESGANAPSDEIKSKMCKIFGCSMDYLMGKSKFKTPEEELQDVTAKINEHYKNNLINLGIDIKDIEELLSLNLAMSNNKISLEERTKPIIRKINYISKTYSSSTVNHFISIMKNILLEEQKIIVEKDYEKLKQDYMKTIEASKVLVQYIEENQFEKYYMCPVYGQISAGQPNWAEENIEGRIPIDPELMNIVNPEEHYFLRVNGESMNKIVRNGAFALIHKQNYVNNGEIAVVLVNGNNATLKRFSKKGNVIVLTPESTDKTIEQQIYTKESDVKIIGKYVGKMEFNN